MQMCIATHIGHLYQTTLLFPGSLPIVTSATLRLLYSLLYSEHIDHNQVLSFLPFPSFSHVHSPLSVWTINESVTFKSHTIIVVGSICHFYSVTKLGVPIFGTNRFAIVISSWWIISFTNMKWPALSLLTNLVKIIFVRYEYSSS
jgi:hypothetical protein